MSEKSVELLSGLHVLFVERKTKQVATYTTYIVVYKFVLVENTYLLYVKSQIYLSSRSIYASSLRFVEIYIYIKQLLVHDKTASLAN